MKQFILILVLMVSYTSTQGQVTPWVLNGNATTNPGIDFLGTTDNIQMDFRTNNTVRMRLTESLVNQNFGWYNTNSLDFSGHLGIGSPVPAPPLTYLHINAAPIGGVTVGYRPWMRVGTFCTEGTDGLYSGMRAINGMTHSIVNWSDDAAGVQGPDPICFVFTSTPDNTTTANTLAGLEIARMIPAANGNEGFLGVGDWFTAAVQPTDRLHLLDGRLRIQTLPEDLEAVGLTKVMMVDDVALPNAEHGVVKWMDMNNILAADCEWTMNSGTNNHVYTAFGGSDPNCPDDADAVAIGVDLSTITPPSKVTISTRDFVNGLEVNTSTITGANYGVVSNITGATTLTHGFYATTSGYHTTSHGIKTISDGAHYSGYGGAFISNDGAKYTWGSQNLVNGGTQETIGAEGLN